MLRLIEMGYTCTNGVYEKKMHGGTITLFPIDADTCIRRITTPVGTVRDIRKMTFPNVETDTLFIELIQIENSKFVPPVPVVKPSAPVQLKPQSSKAAIQLTTQSDSPVVQLKK